MLPEDGCPADNLARLNSLDVDIKHHMGFRLQAPVLYGSTVVEVSMSGKDPSTMTENGHGGDGN